MKLGRLHKADCGTLVLILSMFAYGAYCHNDLPDTIPIHFNGAGEADGFGSKSMLWTLPVLAIFLFLFIKGLNNFFSGMPIESQRRWSSGMKGKSDKFIRESQRHSTEQLGYILLIAVALLAYGFVSTVHLALNGGTGINTWPLWLIMATLFIPILKIMLFSLRKDS